MVTKRVLITLAATAVLLAGFADADTLYLRDGEQEPGRLVEMNKDTLIFDGIHGTKRLPKSDVLKVQLQRSRIYDDVESVDAITDPDLRAALERQPDATDYPSAGYVTLLHRRTFDLTRPGLLRETTRHIAKVLRQRGEDVATKNIYYFEDLDKPAVDFALTVTSDGRVLHLSDAALKNESVYAHAPQYRRLARYRFACKEPRPGNIIDVQYTVERELEPLVRDFYESNVFQGAEPILADEVVVRITRDREDELARDLTLADAVELARTVDGDIVTLQWAMKSPRPGILSEPNMPPSTHFAPTLTLSLGASWSTIVGEYAAHIANLPPLSEAQRELAQRLAAEGGAEALHNYVARNIQSIDVGQRNYRMIPSPPADVLDRGFGNELDKNFAYCALLRAADIHCEFALVRSREEGPLPSDAPSLRAFGNSAVLLREGGYFSYAASELLPYATLPGGLQNAPTLVVATGGSSIERTQQPVPDAEQDSTRFDARLDAEGNLDVAVTFASTGNSGVWLRRLKDLDQQQLRNQLQQLAAYLHPAAVLEEYDVTDFSDLAVPPTLTVRCRVQGYAVKAGDDLLLLNLPAVKYRATDVGKPAREYDLFWLRVARESTEGVIHLPEGFRVYALPSDVACSGHIVTYEAATVAASGAVRFNDLYVRPLQEASREHYPGFKQCKERRARLAKERIVLIRD